MNKPLVSVVMAVCNVERFLAEAIESILGQNFTDFEFVIADFGSTDNSKAIIARYAARDPRVEFHEILPFGLVEARNTACSLAQGRYFAMMDGDDVALPDRLSLEVAFMEKHPEVGLVGGATEWIDASGRTLGVHDFPTEDREIRFALAVRCPFSHASVMLRREAFRLVGGYRPVFLQAEDYDLWLRIADHFQVANLEQTVLKYRIHPHQLTLRKRALQTLSVLAAQTSASARRTGKPDPLGPAPAITPELLAREGIPIAAQQIAVASDYLLWIRTMAQAGEYACAREAAKSLLRSPDSRYFERWQIADLYLALAKLDWRDKRYWKSLLSAGQAVMSRPLVLGRPLKPVLGRLGLA